MRGTAPFAAASLIALTIAAAAPAMAQETKPVT